jgi:hypothetical protein
MPAFVFCQFLPVLPLHGPANQHDFGKNCFHPFRVKILKIHGRRIMHLLNTFASNWIVWALRKMKGITMTATANEIMPKTIVPMANWFGDFRKWKWIRIENKPHGSSLLRPKAGPFLLVYPSFSVCGLINPPSLDQTAAPIALVSPMAFALATFPTTTFGQVLGRG